MSTKTEDELDLSQSEEDTDCPFCGASKYVQDAAYVEHEDVWHYRCHNCYNEWIE